MVVVVCAFAVGVFAGWCRCCWLGYCESCDVLPVVVVCCCCGVCAVGLPRGVWWRSRVQLEVYVACGSGFAFCFRLPQAAVALRLRNLKKAEFRRSVSKDRPKVLAVDF
jgi:hypothetical protein